MDYSARIISGQANVMGNINIYRIDNKKTKLLISKLKDEFNDTDDSYVREYDNNGTKYEFSFYLNKGQRSERLSWQWLLSEFELDIINRKPNPKAVLLIRCFGGNNNLYAVTYGMSHFLVDKYCDREFGFEFAKRVEFEEVKTTTLTSPGLKRNKTISTYVDYDRIEFESGESFAKLKVRLRDYPEKLIKPILEIGTSISFLLQQDSFASIISLIEYIERTLSREVIHKIPILKKVKEEEEIEFLNKELLSSVGEDIKGLTISELDIVGVMEVFNSNQCEFVIRHNRKRKIVTSLEMPEVKAFCEENGFVFDGNILDFYIDVLDKEGTKKDYKVRDLIDFVVDGRNCVLSRGVWYSYNSDFLLYLEESLRSLECFEYDEKYDYSSLKHNNYINEMFQLENEKGKTSLEAIKRKYYLERAYNNIMNQAFGYELHDRKQSYIKGHSVEIMDLYKDGCMYAVKIGNSSSKLCYAVDQSLTAIKMYKSGEIQTDIKIKDVCLWIVLHRSNKIEDALGKPDISKLDMLMFKIRVDRWMKEVRMMGYTPKLRVNYMDQ